MDQAGAFLVGGRLVVRSDALDAWERQQAATSRRAAPRSDDTTAHRAKGSQRRQASEQLAPLWWRETEDRA